MLLIHSLVTTKLRSEPHTVSPGITTLKDMTVTGRQINSDISSSPPESTTVILFLPVFRRLLLTNYNEWLMLQHASPVTRATLIADWRSCSMRSSTGLTSEIMWRSSWCSWSIDAWTAGHLGTSPFTASNCPARHHLRSTERNLPHVPRHRLNTYGRPQAFAIAGPFAWTLSTIRTPPKLLSNAGYVKTLLLAARQYCTQHNRGLYWWYAIQTDHIYWHRLLLQFTNLFEDDNTRIGDFEFREHLHGLCDGKRNVVNVLRELRKHLFGLVIDSIFLCVPQQRLLCRQCHTSSVQWQLRCAASTSLQTVWSWATRV